MSAGGRPGLSPFPSLPSEETPLPAVRPMTRCARYRGAYPAAAIRCFISLFNYVKVNVEARETSFAAPLLSPYCFRAQCK